MPVASLPRLRVISLFFVHVFFDLSSGFRLVFSGFEYRFFANLALIQCQICKESVFTEGLGLGSVSENGSLTTHRTGREERVEIILGPTW